MIFTLLDIINSIKKFPFYIITPTIYAIGNASEQINLAANYTDKRKKDLIVIKINVLPKFLEYSICNDALFESLQLENQNNKYKVIRFLLWFFVNLEFFFQRTFILFFRKLFKIKFKEKYIFPAIGIDQIYGTKKINLKTINYKTIKPFRSNNELLIIDPEKVKYCENKIRKLGLEREDKIVCVHSRDSEYRGDLHRKNYRNSDINNYIDTINFLIQKGYKVIRMGKNSNKKINLQHKNFIDYNFVEIQEDLLDLYLIKRCEFYIGSQSGILDVAHMFNKPILLTNMCELYSAYPRKDCDLGIFKKISNKVSGEIINISNFAKMQFKYHDPQIEIKDLIFDENSPEDLLESTKEFLENLEKKNSKTELQKNFNELIKKQHEIFFYKRPRNQHNLLKQIDALKMIRMLKLSEGALCNTYLKKQILEQKK